MTKKIILLTCIIGLFMSMPIFGNNIPWIGEWGGKKKGRSLITVPEAPTASVEGNVLSIQFVDALSDLVVTVSSQSGAVVYQSVLSGGSSSTYDIPLNVSNGNYLLGIEHAQHGSLYGEFTVSD